MNYRDLVIKTVLEHNAKSKKHNCLGEECEELQKLIRDRRAEQKNTWQKKEHTLLGTIQTKIKDKVGGGRNYTGSEYYRLRVKIEN